MVRTVSQKAYFTFEKRTYKTAASPGVFQQFKPVFGHYQSVFFFFFFFWRTELQNTGFY